MWGFFFKFLTVGNLIGGTDIWIVMDSAGWNLVCSEDYSISKWTTSDIWVDCCTPSPGAFTVY